MAAAETHVERATEQNNRKSDDVRRGSDFGCRNQSNNGKRRKTSIDGMRQIQEEWEMAEQRSRERLEEEQCWYREQDAKDDPRWIMDADDEDNSDDIDCEDDNSTSKHILVKRRTKVDT